MGLNSPPAKRTVLTEKMKTPDIIESRRKKNYANLKNYDPAMYRDVINSVEAVTLTYQVDTHIASEYESASVSVVCDILGLK